MSAAPILHRDIRAAAFSGELVSWALKYASEGFPVFPAAVIDGRKRPLVKIGRGEAHGSLASTDPVQIQAWWRRWPLAMIGTPTGKPSGLEVLDVDRKNGVDGFETLKRLGISLPSNVVEVTTPSGGAHFYFRYNPESPMLTRAGEMATRDGRGKIKTPGVDVRSDGGMIILPPSRLSLDGPEYAYAPGQTADSLGLPEGTLVW